MMPKISLSKYLDFEHVVFAGHLCLKKSLYAAHSHLNSCVQLQFLLIIGKKPALIFKVGNLIFLGETSILVLWDHGVLFGKARAPIYT